MKNLLTIVIPTWNNPDMLRVCLESLFLYTRFPFKVVIVDNGCSGEVVADLPKTSNDYVRVIEPKSNLGWMKAHNVALKDVDTPYYCLLNDDVIFIPGQLDFWRKLIVHFREENVAAVGPGSNFVAGNQSIHNTKVPIVCDSSFLIGFCMVIKTEIFKSIGGLDPDLPGGDDLDLSIRLLDKGYILRVEKSAYIHHYGQITGRKVHGEDWDSQISQEITNNALMSKHGVRTWQNCTKSYWTLPESWETDDDVVIEDNWYAKKLSKFNGASGLNIGCGAKVIKGAVGVDVRANGDVGEGGQRSLNAVTDIQADGGDIPLEAGSQHYIVAAHVLEHMIDPLAALREWSRLLVPGGSLLLSLPNHEGEDSIMIDYTHLHAYTLDSLEGIIRASGFGIESIERAPYNNLRAICIKPEAVSHV